MKHAPLPPACHPCIVRQALRTAQITGLDEVDQGRVLRTVHDALASEGNHPTTAQHIGRNVADQALLLGGLPPEHDPYLELKRRSNRLALSCVPALRRRIRQESDPLAAALRVAAAGNIIDFGAKDHGDLDLVRELNGLWTQPFGRFDLESFRQRLGSANEMLYICDNAGEIVFDQLLMETLLAIRPTLRIHAALREMPIINDATLADGREIGLDRQAHLLSSGSRVAGTFLDETTAEFQSLFARADIVVSKGQGNFGTLQPNSDPRVFFILRVKCAPVAATTQHPLDSLLVLQGTTSRI